MAEWGGISKNESIPPDHALILVAIVPTPRDLEIARVLGWYRIPYRFAPKIVQVDYLAFYQPSIFGKNHAHCIESIAPVTGVELTTRREIIRDEPDHPRANEEYYKIQLDSLKNITYPIQADKWKRITFLYTTGERFARAKSISDLVVRSEERKTLWRSLRERASGFESGANQGVDDLDLDESILIMLGDLQKIQDHPKWCQDH